MRAIPKYPHEPVKHYSGFLLEREAVAQIQGLRKKADEIRELIYHHFDKQLDTLTRSDASAHFNLTNQGSYLIKLDRKDLPGIIELAPKTRDATGSYDPFRNVLTIPNDEIMESLTEYLTLILNNNDPGDKSPRLAAQRKLALQRFKEEFDFEWTRPTGLRETIVHELTHFTDFNVHHYDFESEMGKLKLKQELINKLVNQLKNQSISKEEADKQYGKIVSELYYNLDSEHNAYTTEILHRIISMIAYDPEAFKGIGSFEEFLRYYIDREPNSKFVLDQFDMKHRKKFLSRLADLYMQLQADMH
jgi:hypothetical protein